MAAVLAASLLLASWVGNPGTADAQDAHADFNATNTNRDAAVDRNEYRGRMVEVFYFADGNRDGVVTEEELADLERVEDGVFASADANGDGAIVLQEFVTFRLRDFEAADKNRDGVLVLQEVETWSPADSAPAGR